MDWKTLLAYISGSVDDELLLRNEYLVAENQILPDQIKGCIHLSDAERQTFFCSTEVWTLGGLVTFYVLCFIKLDTREVHIAGITLTPNEQWMMQVART